MISRSFVLLPRPESGTRLLQCTKRKDLASKRALHPLGKKGTEVSAITSLLCARSLGESSSIAERGKVEHGTVPLIISNFLGGKKGDGRLLINFGIHKPPRRRKKRRRRKGKEMGCAPERLDDCRSGWKEAPNTLPDLSGKKEKGKGKGRTQRSPRSACSTAEGRAESRRSHSFYLERKESRFSSGLRRPPGASSLLRRRPVQHPTALDHHLKGRREKG